MAAQKGEELNDQQKMFADEYLVSLNAKQSAIKAGYSEKTAESKGSQLLRIVKVAEYIQGSMDKRSERTEIDADWVLKTIKDTTVALLPDEEKNAAHIFKGCELLGKHLKLFTDKIEHTGKDNGPIEFTNTERAARLAALLERGRQERDRQSDT